MAETRNELLRAKMDGADTPEAKDGIGFCGTCVHFPVPMGEDAHVEGPCLADDPPIRTHASLTCKRSPNMWVADDSSWQVDIEMRVRIRARVWLPDAIVDDGEGNVTKAARERAWEAFVDCLPQDTTIYIDGEDEPAAHVFIEPDDREDDVEMWAE